MNVQVRLLLGLLLLFLSGVSPVLAEMQIFSIRHRPAEDLLPIIQQQVSAETKVSAYQDKLIVSGPAAEIERTGRLLRELDREIPQVGITVRQTVDQVRTGTDAGASVRLGTGRDSFAVEGQRRLGNTSDTIEQRVTVLMGESALIQVGRDVPYTNRWAAWAGRTAGVAVSTEYQSINTGFSVRPIRFDGATVVLEVTPQMEAFRQQGGGYQQAPVIEFHQSASLVKVPVGEWFPLSSSLQQGGEIQQEILSWRVGDGYERREIWVRVER